MINLQQIKYDNQKELDLILLRYAEAVGTPGALQKREKVKEFVYSLIVKECEKKLKKIKLDHNDIIDVGEHYWDGDYIPTLTEAINLSKILNKKIEDKM